MRLFGRKEEAEEEQHRSAQKVEELERRVARVEAQVRALQAGGRPLERKPA